MDWLPSPGADSEDGDLEQSNFEDFGYTDFYDRVGAIIMGAGTYEFILDSAEDWPYTSVPVIVMTTRNLPEHPGNPRLVRFSAEDPRRIVAELRAGPLSARPDSSIWLLGGGKLAATFAAHDLIDEYQIAVIPVLLGQGIPLIASFDAGSPQPLRWVESRSFPEQSGGVVLHVYERNRGAA